MKHTCMLDTNFCLFIMRERPEQLLKVLQAHVENKDRKVISAIAYAELPWDKSAVDATTEIKRYLAEQGTPIVSNDAAIAGNAIAVDCVLVTNNTREINRVPELRVEDWTIVE